MGGLPLLGVKGRHIVDPAGRVVRLRGLGVGGWMNMENFINGFPGVEHRLRARTARALGRERAARWFDRCADHFLRDGDMAFAASLGANVLRLPVNYRHFESDAAPFAYKEAGFDRLRRALDGCARHGLYAIIDLHAAPGWQNPDWHCDNWSRTALLWSHPHFAQRTERLWAEMASRFRDHSALCGYDLINEPATHDPHEPDAREPLLALYRRLITAVRAVDPRHLIFLEGDMFGSRFDGLEDLVLPDAGNVVWSFHDYGRAQMGPGRYPGRFGTRWTDAAAVEEAVHSLPGPRFATRHGIPLWVGEFGASFSGSPEDEDDRLQALDAQIAVFDQAGWSWTAWTLKDMGAMGLITVDPDSAYGRLAAVTAPGRAACRADRWSWRRERPGPVSAAVRGLAVALEEALGPTAHDVARAAGDRVGTGADTRVGVGVDRLVDGIEARVCSDFAADLLQERFVSALAGVIAGDEALEAAASSFSFGECRVRKPYADLLADRLSLPV